MSPGGRPSRAEVSRREVERGGCRLSFTVAGPPGAPFLLLAHAIGTTSSLWDPQADALAGAYRVIRYDARGHGRSSVPPGEYTLAELGADALGVLDAAGAERAHVCGLSLGGITAMWLALHAASRISSVVLANTAARIATRAFWEERIALVRTGGLDAVAAVAPSRWFTPAFRSTHPEVVSALTATLARCTPAGYIGCSAALRDADLREAVHRIQVPVLVISGTEDPATPPADADDLCARIAAARRCDLDASHLSNVEAAAAFTAAVRSFLADNR
jgi:3-oxoadipate enol-lactonase